MANRTVYIPIWFNTRNYIFGVYETKEDAQDRILDVLFDDSIDEEICPGRDEFCNLLNENVEKCFGIKITKEMYKKIMFGKVPRDLKHRELYKEIKKEMDNWDYYDIKEHYTSTIFPFHLYGENKNWDTYNLYDMLENIHQRKYGDL